MARGPDPKPAEQRRRRNKPERGEWVELPAVDPKKPILPELPKRKPSEEDPAGKWHPRTRAVWKAWREDPAATQYGPAEIASAIELAWIHDRSVRENERLVNEVRAREDRLGLSSKGKRDLRWRAPTETAAGEEPEDEAELAPVTRLRAVV
jgi:hypothetical protein